MREKKRERGQGWEKKGEKRTMEKNMVDLREGREGRTSGRKRVRREVGLRRSEMKGGEKER